MYHKLTRALQTLKESYKITEMFSFQGLHVFIPNSNTRGLDRGYALDHGGCWIYILPRCCHALYFLPPDYVRGE